jgi:hypothetical protein
MQRVYLTLSYLLLGTGDEIKEVMKVEERSTINDPLTS